MRLPLLLSVPHAGLRVPPEVASACALSAQEIADDGDGGAAVIYAIEREVHAFVTTDVARAIVDMNRAPGDLGKDGVVKTHTCWDVPVWKEPLASGRIAALIDTYHRPYHERLRGADSTVLLAVDCHTMAAHAPPVAPDVGRERPAVCLSDGGGTLPEAWFRALIECFEESFACEVAVNRPFRGGHIIRSHAPERPWVQVELSRAAWIPDEVKRERVLLALSRWCAGMR